MILLIVHSVISLDNERKYSLNVNVIFIKKRQLFQLRGNLFLIFCNRTEY